MNDYIRFFEQALEQRNIRYRRTDKLVVFFRKYSDGHVDLQMKFVFLLFPGSIDMAVSVVNPLSPEQIILSYSLLKEVNDGLFGGEIDFGPLSNHIRYCGSFDPLSNDQWCDEACEQMQEFIVDYTTEIIPNMLFGIYREVTGQAVAYAQ